MSKKPKPSTIAGFPKPLRHALAYWSAWRNMGFDAAEIFFGFGEVSGSPDCVYLQLQTQGKSFTAVAERLPGADADDVFSEWVKLAKVSNAASLEEQVANYRAFPVGNDHAFFIAMVNAMVAKGIYIPELAPNFAVGSA